MTDRDHKIILFDGYCNLCNSWVDFVIKRDRLKIFKFAPLQSKKGEELRAHYHAGSRNIDTIILVSNGKIYTKSAAVLNILKDLSPVWKLLYIFIIIPRPLRDLLYDVIAAIRYKIFGKRKSCRMPSPEEAERFL